MRLSLGFRTARLPVLLGLALMLAWAAAARAAEPVFPPASRIGIVPPPGFAISKNFQEFQHTEWQANILMVELPGYAFEALEKDMTAELQKNPAVTRQDVTLSDSGHGLILFNRQEGPQGPVLKWTLLALVADVTAIVTAIVPDTVKDAAPDAAVRAALATLAVRKVPTEEQLGVLPFTMADLQGFRLVRVQPGSAAMLTDGPSDVIESSQQPLLLVSLALERPPQPSERDAFARRLLGSVPGLKDIRILRSEPLRMGGHPGHEVLIEAKDPKTDTDLTAVQWVRFGSGGMLRIVGIARKDAWPGIFGRLRAVRDGLEVR